MIIHSIKILTIPRKIQCQLNTYLYKPKKIKIIGYKIKLNHNYIKIPIIEFEDHSRISLLFNEINIS